MVRLNRLYPQAGYKPAGHTLSVPRPSEGSGGVGAAPLRDRDLLDWCTNLVTAVLEDVGGSLRAGRQGS
jgi:transcription-repair coupling factor (superfamily II helicase)